MREVITVQIGQCGNQLGLRFWDLALQEHTRHSRGYYDDAFSSFFRNITKDGQAIPLPVGNFGADRRVRVDKLRARAVCIDMEEGVLARATRSPLGGLFDANTFIRDNPGSGNNWSVGHWEHGPRHEDSIIDAIRSQVEACDSLQTFLVMHSLGGGTGSGLGTYTLGLLKEHFPDAFRFATVVVPSLASNDVVTAPYNTILSLDQLIRNADAVLPVDNDALAAIEARATAAATHPSNVGGSRSGGAVAVGALADATSGDDALRCVLGAEKVMRSLSFKPGAPAPGAGSGTQYVWRAGAPVERDRPSDSHRTDKSGSYDRMNNAVAAMLTSLTASVRFGGRANIDVNELTTNLVPFEGMSFLLPALAPLGLTRGQTMSSHRGDVDALFDEVLRPENQLLSVDIRKGTCLALGLLLRGDASFGIDDVTKNVARMRSKIQFPPWNTEAFKTGLCDVPPPGAPYSLLSLANSSAVVDVLAPHRARFAQLYRRSAHFHHYTGVDGFEEHMFDEAVATVDDVIDMYQTVHERGPKGECPYVFRPVL